MWQKKYILRKRLKAPCCLRTVRSQYILIATKIIQSHLASDICTTGKTQDGHLMDIPKHKEVNTNIVSKVFVIYTGGTIGMTRNNEDVLVPAKNKLENNLRKLGTFHDEKFATKTLNNDDMLVLPMIANVKRIAYSIYEWDDLMDSSNMSMADWSRIARDIGQVYNFYDGFVVLHGTDTLAYTASALSFMLQNLGKTVVVTGSQIPCFETRSDGRDNIINALIFAGNYTIPEVCVYFDNKLMRGNRTVKVSAGSLHAFDSPNLSPLAHAMINIDIDHQNILKPSSLAKFKGKEIVYIKPKYTILPNSNLTLLLTSYSNSA